MNVERKGQRDRDPFEHLFGRGRGRAATEQTDATLPLSDEDAAVAIPRWKAVAAYVVVAVAAVVLLVLHTLKVDVTVDTTSLGLLALLLILPLAPYIRRISAGGVEAEIGSRDAKRAQASAAELPPAPPEPPVQPGELTVQELIERDPPLGLAKLRIEIERELRALYDARIPDGPRRGLSIGPMTRELRAHGALPPEIAAPLLEFNNLANRAVHGEYVATDIAEDIAGVGERVLAALKAMDKAAEPV